MISPFALTIFLGAFLLFQVQPLIGKYILPWFGGGPGVWTTCMLFFQVLLLGGYAYAHLTTVKLRPRTQAILHLVLLGVALALLPIMPADQWKPTGTENPTTYILLLLTVSIGLPYFVLSSTGPLIQHWFLRANPGRSPYRLYALSNVGSLLALLTYPFYFETHFTRRTQAMMWGWALVVYALCCAACVRKIWPSTGSVNAAPATQDAPRAAVAVVRPISAVDRALWFLLPACASILLLATTNKICMDVAVIPFLWILPLALYLLSFIICFDSPRWYVRFPFMILLMGAFFAAWWALTKGTDASIFKQLAAYCASLFVCAMVCHGEVYRLRPAPERLTGFYLMIAAGGAFGGVFVACLAPLLFNNYYELQSGLILCSLLALFCWAREPAAHLLKRFRAVAAASAADAVAPLPWLRSRSLVAGLLMAVTISLALSFRSQLQDENSEKIQVSRNFYGVLTVFEHRRDDPLGHHFLLQHGRITHGLQFADQEESRWPTTYYGEECGVGLAIRSLPEKNRRIGLVGLGTGTLASYGKAGDYLHIYEINPAVRQIATSRFSYLSNSPAKIEIALGDARLSMEREPPQQFDLLVLDAFSSDAIPVHLLTEEAFRIYQRHMKTNGIVAVHISNHYLDLEPVVENLARTFGYQQAMVDFDETDDEWWLYSSTWILLTRDGEILKTPAIQKAATKPKSDARFVSWTDDFTSLFQILK